jgi:hypothetical protein
MGAAGVTVAAGDCLSITGGSEYAGELLVEDVVLLVGVGVGVLLLVELLPEKRPPILFAKDDNAPVKAFQPVFMPPHIVSSKLEESSRGSGTTGCGGGAGGN